MKMTVKIIGTVDVPDDWGEMAQDVADYRYNEQLELEDALDELNRKLKDHPNDVEIEVLEHGA